MAVAPEQPQGIDLSLIAEVQDIATFKVRGNRVLVKSDTEFAPKTNGGIWLPDSSRDKSRKSFLVTGTVVNTGSQVTDLKAGDVVYYYTANGTGAVRQGEDIYFIYPEYAMEASITV